MTILPTPLRIRRALPSEAARLSTLMRLVFLDAYAQCSTSRNVAAYLDEAFDPAQQLAELTDGARVTWVAEADGEWLGFAQARYPASTPTCIDLQRPAQLHRLYLASGATGRGLGRRLLDVVRTHARASGADGLWLSVWQKAPAPIAFYEREGFRAVGKAVFQVGDDALDDWIMQAPLAP